LRYAPAGAAHAIFRDRLFQTVTQDFFFPLSADPARGAGR